MEHLCRPIARVGTLTVHPQAGMELLGVLLATDRMAPVFPRRAAAWPKFRTSWQHLTTKAIPATSRLLRLKPEVGKH